MNDVSGTFFLVVVVGFLVWLSSEPRIYPESVAHAEKVCEQNGGWAFIEEGISEFSSLTCKNGAEFSYDWNKFIEDRK